jgi:C-terminal processing protease CtpA/Prc
MLSLAACGKQDASSEAKARPLTAEQKKLEFEVAIQQFRDFYAPLQYKERALKISFEEIADTLRAEVAASTNDHEYYKVLGKLAASFQDGHVGVSIPSRIRYRLPFILDFFDGHYIVTYVDEVYAAATGLSVGDELLKMDGKAVGDIAVEVSPYHSMGYERTNQRLFAAYVTIRDYVHPTSTFASLDFKRSFDGAEYNLRAAWKEVHPVPTARTEASATNLISMANDASILEFGENTPFYYTPQVQGVLRPTKVTVSREKWAAMGQTGEPADIFALLYKWNGKMVLLVRFPNYVPEDAAKSLLSYQILLSDYSQIADVLVIDQTHNPGGSVSYVEELARLFIKQPGPSFGFAPRADRDWLQMFIEVLAEPGLPQTAFDQFQAMYRELDAAHERGDFLGPQMSLTNISTTITENTVWTKPVLLLIDELCGSGGDAFPMLMKGHKAATLFGHRTAGMGGNVTSMDKIGSSGVNFNLTRSLFYLATPDGTVSDEAVIENNGVTPDIQRDYGLADFREGFASYAADFSTAATNLVTAK